ncbi:MAG: cellulose biosynthesis protein BcsN [Alsobacter sp.]
MTRIAPMALLLALAACSPTLETVSLKGEMTGSLAAEGQPSRGLLVDLPGTAGRVAGRQAEDMGWGRRWEAVLQPTAKDPSLGRFVVAEAGADGRGDMEPARPSRAGIAAELAAAFPDGAMRIVEDPLYNAYGPFGMAVGLSEGRTCAYGWQWIADQPRLRQPPGSAVSWRVTLCRKDATPGQLAALLKQVAVKPIGAAQPARPAAVRSARAVAVAAPAPTQQLPSGTEPIYLGATPGSRPPAAAPQQGASPWIGAPAPSPDLATPVPPPPAE